MVELTPNDKPAPWLPMTSPLDLSVMGKLAEEASELASACNRSIIQGVDECEPVTGKPNRQWLAEEIADVLANIILVGDHFQLDQALVEARVERKLAYLRQWNEGLAK